MGNHFKPRWPLIETGTWASELTFHDARLGYEARRRFESSVEHDKTGSGDCNTTQAQMHTMRRRRRRRRPQQPHLKGSTQHDVIKVTKHLSAFINGPPADRGSTGSISRRPVWTVAIPIGIIQHVWYLRPESELIRTGILSLAWLIIAIVSSVLIHCSNLWKSK